MVNRQNSDILGDAAEWLTPAQIARKLNKHTSTVLRWILNGVRGHQLPSYFLGGQRHVRLDDLEAFLAAINGKRVGLARRVNEREQRRLDEELAAKGF